MKDHVPAEFEPHPHGVVDNLTQLFHYNMKVCVHPKCKAGQQVMTFASFLILLPALLEVSKAASLSLFRNWGGAGGRDTFSPIFELKKIQEKKNSGFIPKCKGLFHLKHRYHIK